MSACAKAAGALALLALLDPAEAFHGLSAARLAAPHASTCPLLRVLVCAIRRPACALYFNFLGLCAR